MQQVDMFEDEPTVELVSGPDEAQWSFDSAMEAVHTIEDLAGRGRITLEDALAKLRVLQAEIAGVVTWCEGEQL